MTVGSATSAPAAARANSGQPAASITPTGLPAREYLHAILAGDVAEPGQRLKEWLSNKRVEIAHMSPDQIWAFRDLLLHNYAGAHGVGGVDPSLDDRKISNVISTLGDIADVVIPCDREFALINALGRDDIGTQLKEWMHRNFPDPKRDLPPYHAGNYAAALHHLWGGSRGITDPKIREVWNQLRAVADSAAPAAGDEVITPEAVRDSDRARALTGGNPSRVLPATTDHSPAKKLGVLTVLSGHGGI